MEKDLVDEKLKTRMRTVKVTGKEFTQKMEVEYGEFIQHCHRVKLFKSNIHVSGVLSHNAAAVLTIMRQVNKYIKEIILYAKRSALHNEQPYITI